MHLGNGTEPTGPSPRDDEPGVPVAVLDGVRGSGPHHELAGRVRGSRLSCASTTASSMPGAGPSRRAGFAGAGEVGAGEHERFGLAVGEPEVLDAEAFLERFVQRAWPDRGAGSPSSTFVAPTSCSAPFPRFVRLDPPRPARAAGRVLPNKRLVATGEATTGRWPRSVVSGRCGRGWASSGSSDLVSPRLSFVGD